MINETDANKIVTILNQLLNKNINIMNEDGIIIASNQNERIGNFHSVAKECIDRNETISISSFEVSQYIGSLPGVNVPLVMEGNVIGVIGISGDPREVSGYGEVVKGLVEHLINEQKSMQTRVDLIEHKKNIYTELFNKDINSNYESIEFNANKFNIIYENIYIVISKFEEIHTKIPEISNYLNNIIGYSFYLYDNKFVSIVDSRLYCEEDILNIKMQIYIKFGSNIDIYYGTKTRSIKDVTTQFQLADTFSGLNDSSLLPIQMSNTEDLLELYLLENIKDDIFNNYMSFFNNVFFDDKLDDETIITIKNYYDMGMDKQATADAMYVHKNTINYRLNKFKERYEIDIFNPKICSRLYMAILFYLKQNGEKIKV